MEAFAFLLLLVPLWVHHVEALGCPGCPEEVDHLTEDDQRIVDFAMVQLEMVSDNAHARKVLQVRDFKRQVVSGMKYIFTLDLVDTECPKTDQLTSCDSDDIPTESCTVSVWERVWMNSTIFNGDDVRCTRHQANQDGNVCRALQHCSECLESPTCKWCKEPGYDGPRCSDNFSASACSPAEVLDPQNTMSILSDPPMSWRNYMRPEHVTFALRPNTPGSIDITFVAISMGVTMLSNATDDIKVTFETSCDGHGKTERNTCHGLHNGATVVFTANVEVLRCPKNPGDWKQTFEIFTESYASSERMTVDVDMLCGCECESSGNNQEECPMPPDPCDAKTSCVQCMEEPDCAWRKSELSSPNGDVLPHCFQNDGVSSSEDILNPQGDVKPTQNSPLNLTASAGFSIFQPQQVSVSLRPGQPQVIDFLWGKKQPKVDMFRIEMGDNAPDFLEVTYFTSCRGKFAKHKRTTCPRVWMGYDENNHPVEFQATIKLLKCPVNAADWNQTFQISPVNKYSQYDPWVEGLDEILNIDLTLLCQACDCEKPTDAMYEEYSPKCSGQGTYKCGQCQCPPGREGPACEVDDRLEEGSYAPSPHCLRHLRKPTGGLWSCVNEDGMEGCQLVCPVGLVAQSGSYIHCNGSAWNEDPDEFSCVNAMALVVGGGKRSESKYKGDLVKVVGDTGVKCSASLANVPNMQMYGHTVDVLDGKAIVCGGTSSRVYTFTRKCHFLSTRRESAESHYFKHHSSLIEKRRKHSSVVIKDRLYLIGGEYSPNTTEYMSLTKNRKPEKWMVGCGESKVTATEENLEEILDFMEKKLGSFAILTVANGQVLGRSLGGKIDTTAGYESYFHLLETNSGGKKQGHGYYVLTTHSAGRSSKKTKKMMGVYKETCKSFIFNQTVYMKLGSEDKNPYFLYVNGNNLWSIGTELHPYNFLMYFNSGNKPLLKYKQDKWNHWKYKYRNKWYNDREMTVIPRATANHYGTWHKGFDLGVNIVDACAVKTGIETFLVIGVGNAHKEMIEFNVTDGSARKIVAKLNKGRVSHECAYMENSNERMIVIAGGAFEAKDGVTLNSTEIFNLDSETTEEAGDLNVAREDFVMYVLDGVLYASTGADNNSNMVKDNEVFDVETKSWELLSGEPVVKRDDAAAAGVPYDMVNNLQYHY